MFTFLRRVFNPGAAHLDNLLAKHAASVASRFDVVRDGIVYTFEEHKSGITYVYAARRTKPYKRATFQVENKAEAVAWREDGVVPAGETADLLRQLQAGTWPKSRSVDDIF
ncbi:hypothetical protein ACFQAT_28390 [Undibacterium arcticum]|uniref:Uncharacterized protein n=1 Tax=Undibacterium arcticum TaxID=1762892 RepID=A0ABV7FAT9_9BURK